MQEIKTDVCICGINVFLHKDGEHAGKYENMLGTIPHTKLRCQINEIVLKQLGHLQVQINQIKVRLNLE